jgi:tetratricopeptide (TPR) repeat protein
VEEHIRTPDPAASLAGIPDILNQKHLSRACLSTLRDALRDISPTADPQRWAAVHLILGSALRLHGQRVGAPEQAEHYAEAIHAFEMAASVYCQFPPSVDEALLTARAANDSVDVVLAATKGGAIEGISLLHEAAHLLNAGRVCLDRRADLRNWAVELSNFGCALTLLGRRVDDADAVGHLEEAIDAFREVLNEPGVRELTQEYASVQVNLADALHALGERTMPAERAQFLERAVDALATALSLVAPAHLRWMVEIRPTAFA